MFCDQTFLGCWPMGYLFKKLKLCMLWHAVMHGVLYSTSAEVWLSYRYKVLVHVQVFVRWCRLLFFLISAPDPRDDIDSGSG